MARAIVIGAGHNGLVAACALAGEGHEVTVLERRDVVGGACITEELIPGFRVSSAAYSFSLFRPEIAAALDLAAHGLEVYAKVPRMFVPLLDGRHFFVHPSEAQTQDEIAKISQADADAYPRWNAFWEEVARIVRPIMLQPAPSLPSLEMLFARLGRTDMFRLAVTGSAADAVSAFFTSDEVRGAFVGQGIIGTFAPPTAEGTAWVMTYHAFGGELVQSDGTWAYVRGGMGGVTAALASCARSRGVTIVTGAPVDEILVDGGRARGVRAGDTTYDADMVLSNADPKRTFLGLVPDGALPEHFLARVTGFDTRGSVIKVNMALRELPDFASCGAPGVAPGPQHGGTIEISPSIASLEAAFADADAGRPSTTPFMEVFIQSVTDDSLAPAGQHVASCFAQWAPQTDAATWETMREAAGDAVVRTLAAYAPNLPDAIIHREVLGPPDLESRFGLTGGNIFHGELLPGQSFARRFEARTPIPGLYLCGSGAHPGGAVTGAPGWNGAQAALADHREGA